MVCRDGRFVPALTTRHAGYLVEQVEGVTVVGDLIAYAGSFDRTEQGLLDPSAGDRGAGGRIGGPISFLRSRRTSADVGHSRNGLLRDRAAEAGAEIARN